MNSTPVKDLLSDPNHWTTHAFARSNNDTCIYPTDCNACKFCLTGAIIKIAKRNALREHALHRKLISAIQKYTNTPYGVVEFNDNPRTTHKDIIAVLEIAQI